MRGPVLKATKQYISRVFNGDVTIKRFTIPKVVLWGLSGVILLYVSAAGAVSISTPWWLGVGDAPRHIDYAYSVYNLDLPQFNDRLTYPAFNELREGKYGNQPAAVNPPLFYILHAPVIGPLMAAGEWQEAIGLGRAFNILLGIICILVLAWGGWIFGGRNRTVIAIATPAVGMLMYNVIVLNQNYAVDVLLIIFTTLSFIISHKLITKGISKKYFILLTLLSVAGMATKATYIVFLAVSLLALVLAFIVNNPRSQMVKNALKGAVAAGTVLVVVVVAIGWYYYFQNYSVSGSWVSAAPPDFGSSSRPYKSFGEVISSPLLWGMLYKNYAAHALWSIVITTVAACGIAYMYDRTRFKNLISDRKLQLSVGIMLLAYVGIFMTQVSHAVGYGGYYFRYFLPVLLPISLLLAYGLTAVKWHRGLLVPLYAVVMIVTGLTAVLNQSSIENVIEKINSTEVEVDRLFIASTHNGIPEVIPATLIGMMLIGVIALSAAMIYATRLNKYRS